MKHIFPACLLAVIAGCASTPPADPVRPAPTKPANQPARFDYERDDDLDQDLTRSCSADPRKGMV